MQRLTLKIKHCIMEFGYLLKHRIIVVDCITARIVVSEVYSAPSQVPKTELLNAVESR